MKYVAKNVSQKFMRPFKPPARIHCIQKPIPRTSFVADETESDLETACLLVGITGIEPLDPSLIQPFKSPIKDQQNACNGFFPNASTSDSES